MLICARLLAVSDGISRCAALISVKFGGLSKERNVFIRNSSSVSDHFVLCPSTYKSDKIIVTKLQEIHPDLNYTFLVHAVIF